MKNEEPILSRPANRSTPARMRVFLQQYAKTRACEPGGRSCDVGLGKSTVLRYMHAEYAAAGYTTTLLSCEDFPSPYAFLLRICRDFGLDPRRSTPAQREALEAWLVEQYQAGKTVVVFVDEAQRLSSDQLELVRTMLNFETAHHKLLQLVLAGQLDLRDRILAKRNKALRSRIYSPCMMVPLSRMETEAMITFRCERAGTVNPFQPDAADALYSLSGGVPRQALLLAGHAANFAQRLGHRTVSRVLVESAHSEATIPEEVSA